MMKRKALNLVLLLLFSTVLYAQFGGDQAPDPVKWTISTEKVDETHYNLKFHADVIEGWYIYSSVSYGDAGPIPTSIILDTLDHAKVSGEISETGKKTIEGMDEVFEMKVKKFKGWGEYTLPIEVSDASKAITGRFDYMSCNDMECIFPDPVYFKVQLGSGETQMEGIPFNLLGATEGSTEEEVLEPVKWELSTEKVSDDVYRLDAKANVIDGWYIYSIKDLGEGPMPTRLVLDTMDHAIAQGDVTEKGKKTLDGFDPVFEIDVKKFAGYGIYSQDIKVSDPSKDITGFIEYMSCDDEECIFPDPLPFKLNIESGKVLLGLDESTITGDIEKCTYKMDNVDLDSPLIVADGESKEKESESSLLKLLLLGFLGGLVALLTPCVFPMIPMTVGFFTKGSEDKAKGMRRAITYGFMIFLIYIAFSIPFHFLENVSPDIFNEISTNPIINIIFFVVFIIFAISFFGYFEITLPSSFVNKMDSNANKYGGLIGIFFMALTLALVSFSCTGPILGSLLAGAITSDGGAMQLTAGMGGFGLALALPFALFAMFPRWLNSLPSSGGWLNNVKVVLAFVEIALAFKFLSNADLVEHWGLLKYEPFMIIWILCAVGIVLYLLGLIKFPHDSPGKPKLSGARLGFLVVFAAASIYLMSGFRYNETEKSWTALSMMSGLAPPVGYSIFHPKDCPANLNCFKDLDAGLAYAKENGMPVMLDFTGYACVNCRKMEEHVWPKEPVFDIIDDNFVLISLYVDDKAELPKDDQHIYETCGGKKKQIVTVGNKWSTMQIETFKKSTQPLYALIAPDGTLLTDPVPYTPDVDEYAAFLKRGVQGWQQHNGTALK